MTAVTLILEPLTTPQFHSRLKIYRLIPLNRCQLDKIVSRPIKHLPLAH